MTITEQTHQAVLKVSPAACTAAFEPDGEIRGGAWGGELTGDVLKSRCSLVPFVDAAWVDWSIRGALVRVAAVPVSSGTVRTTDLIG
ncbi:hypothetical protein OHB49_42980 (plasmid) [Streptomyces sp. NBC_01717]|uniref:hypothetical protein n=1 Tax=Streptomyces sp. NBC_01717 TaxID=2975918 RepID=UPI002E312BAE|nr:hypothetical protein [Streptomyces sp. NBC_01717]